jgi:hypothetical protein
MTANQFPISGVKVQAARLRHKIARRHQSSDVGCCDGFRTLAHCERCRAHRGRRSKAAREGRRVIGAPCSAGSMGNWLALSVQQGAGAAGVDAANEWRRRDGRPNQR